MIYTFGTDLLHHAHIYPVSLSSDGTETERRLQRLVVDTAHAVYKYTVDLLVNMPGACADNKFQTPPRKSHVRNTCGLFVLQITLNVVELMAWLWAPRLHYNTSEFTCLEPLAQAFKTRKETMENPNFRMTRKWIEKWQLELIKELKDNSLNWVSNVFCS